KHAASVHPEPGSNSPLNSISSGPLAWLLLFLYSAVNVDCSALFVVPEALRPAQCIRDNTSQLFIGQYFLLDV
ncbi:MAG: hypothetical protein SOZ52_06605, partial [Pyramidobacter sp.]|nr:hypothetical protein [Pyramidobacter sp.]